MQPKKPKMQTCMRVWVVIVVVNIGIFIMLQWLVLANLFDFTTYICSANTTSMSSSCTFNIIVLSGTFPLCAFTFVFELCGVSILSIIIKKFETVQAKSAKLGLEVTELQRQLNERPNRNTIHIGRPNNDLPTYTELPNEREQLLTQSQLPNYQSTDTLPEHS